ncbi:FadR/GntR family transcriptional regulator [Bacillus sp. FJAT-42315]|uniref:FadR/GntR family transcriptional regulator n=1 Tax=Bacillus sp. FJAT-42315 TaxID=2014077 RepID=UPI000C2334E7|nr:GntR family transcriptional regulator [Bacillus sp. FJAT-42315]
MEIARSHSKFEKVVEQIRHIILEDGLLPGDKLPSERELSERLSVARSSVREALRALELLGLIETRRGEGTFLRDFRDHQLLELLSTFILQNDEKKQGVIQTKEIIEFGCLSFVIQHSHLEEELSMIAEEMKALDYTETDFFSAMMKLCENELLRKIWTIVSDYEASFYSLDRMVNNKSRFFHLIEQLKTKNMQAIFEAYKQLS